MKRFAMAMAMLLIMTGFVAASETEEYSGKSMDIRYTHLLCQIDYTVGQIDVIHEYATNTSLIEDLSDDKDELVDDREELKDIYEDKNVTVFSDFVQTTLFDDFNKTSYDLQQFKENYTSFIASAKREAFKNDLRNLTEEYKACKGESYTEMSKLMEKYYDSKTKMWEQIIKSMKSRGMNTTEMEDVKAQLEDRLADLEAAIESGNQTQIEAQMQLIREEHLSLWSRFHSGRLNSYLNRIEPAANKYGRSDEVKKIREHIKDIVEENETENETDVEHVKKLKSELEDSTEDMRDISKDMLKRQKNR